MTDTSDENLQAFQRLLKITRRIKKSEVAKALKITDDELLLKLIEWSDQCTFKIDGDSIVVDGSDEVMATLDQQFASWHDGETNKKGKLAVAAATPYMSPSHLPVHGSDTGALAGLNAADQDKYLGMVVPKVRRLLPLSTSELRRSGESDLRAAIATIRDERDRLKHVVFKQADDKEIILFILQKKVAELEEVAMLIRKS